MIDLRVSFRAVRGVVAFGMVAALSGVLYGCSGESSAPSGDNSAAKPADTGSADSKKAVAKPAGGKRDLMEGIPKKDKPR